MTTLRVRICYLALILLPDSRPGKQFRPRKLEGQKRIDLYQFAS